MVAVIGQVFALVLGCLILGVLVPGVPGISVVTPRFGAGLYLQSDPAPAETAQDVQ
ncbi:MAG: hypothetical protein WDN50_07350 [Bradyrhizobium sp.]